MQFCMCVELIVDCYYGWLTLMSNLQSMATNFLV